MTIQNNTGHHKTLDRMALYLFRMGMSENAIDIIYCEEVINA
jgi:hypothetical protein